MTLTVHWTDKKWRDYFNKVEAVDGGCWEWQGYTKPLGYGRCNRNTYGSGMAHRALYVQLHGDSPDLDLDHLCSNRACVNPEHLEYVTTAENIFRSALTKRTETHCKHGHEWIGENIEYDKSSNCFRCKVCRAIEKRLQYLKRKKKAKEAIQC